MIADGRVLSLSQNITLSLLLLGTFAKDPTFFYVELSLGLLSPEFNQVGSFFALAMFVGLNVFAGRPIEPSVTTSISF